ncbi:hypothetical protein [Helicobacter sp.]|uniref:hypothetical protein n=1 Tax=Helicobacter sp. TaxID=218 RepID=UPI0025C57A7C|nr:hypothetical protein [Helicobacter sp.]MBR2495345.1 hypothetical protein [Helicobacter sp.]
MKVLSLICAVLLLCLESSAQAFPKSGFSTQPTLQDESSQSALGSIEPTLDSSVSSAKKFSLYQPIAVSKRSYGSFSIGYSQSHIKAQQVSLIDGVSNSRVDRDFSQIAHGVFFGLERGVHWHNFMLGGYINGVAAQDYSLSFGVRTSYLVARYVIPSVGISWGMQHIKFPNDIKQYNIHGASFNAGIFVNLVRGFGLKLEGSYSYPLVILRGVDARNYGDPVFSGYSFVVSLCMYDFSI